MAPLGGDLAAGSYTLRFDTGGYLGADAFYPEVVVTFAVGADEHYHVPLLLSPFGYSTYRGPELLVRAPRAIVDGREVAASVRIRDGVIAAVEDLPSRPTAPR